MSEALKQEQKLLGADQRDLGQQGENHETGLALFKGADFTAKEAEVDKDEAIVKSSEEELRLVIADADPLTKGEGSRLLQVLKEKGTAVKSVVGRGRGWLKTIPALEQLAANNETGLTVPTVDLSQETSQAGSLEEEMRRVMEETLTGDSREELLTNNAAKLKTVKDGQQIEDAEFTDVTPANAPEEVKKTVEAEQVLQAPEKSEAAVPIAPEGGAKIEKEASHLEGNLAHKREDLENINIALADLLDNQSLSEEEREKERLALLEKRSVALADFEKAANLYEQQSEIGGAQEKLTTAEKSLAEYLKAHPSEKGEEVEKLMRAEAEARQEYEKLRGELVANRVHIALEKRLQQSEEKGEAAKEKLISKVGRKIYDAQKWLGEKNLAKYLGERWQNKDTNTWLTKGIKGAARFGARMASLRTVASVGMLGVAGGAMMLGGGVAAAGVGVGLLRRGLGTIATYYGAHDGMKGWRDTANREKMAQKLTKEELQNAADDDLAERVGLFEIDAKMNNHDLRADENYKVLWQEMERRMVYNSVDSRLDDLLAQSEDKRVELEAKFKSKARNRKIIAGVLAAGVGVGSYLPSIIEGLKGMGGGPTELGAAELPKSGISVPEKPYVDVDNPAVGTVPEMEVIAGAEHVDYQGGNSVWQEIENQYVKRFPEFHDLPKGEQTYLIDQVKDKIASSPDKFGLTDIDKVTADQLKAVDWDNTFAGAKLESPNLSEAQIANIEGPAGHEPMAIAETEVTTDKLPEAELKIRPDKIPDANIVASDIEPEAKPGVLAGEAGPEMKLKTPVVSPEDRVEDLMEPTPASLEQVVAKEMWAPDKAKAFTYLNAEDAEYLSKNPDILQARLEDFNNAAKRATELLAKGEINKLGFYEQGQPVLGANGKMYIIEQYGKGKDQWYAWQVKADGELDQIVNNRQGWFGAKAVDLFKGKELHDALGYGAEPKGEAMAVNEVAEKALRRKAQPPF